MSESFVSAIQQFRRRVEALADLAFTPGERLVAWAILLHANAGGECWPGTATLRRLTGLNSRTIKRIRHRLLVAFDYVPGSSRRGARRTPSRYRFLLDRGHPVTSQATQPVALGCDDRGCDATSTGGSLTPEPVVPDHPKVQEGPSEGSPNNGKPSNASVNVGRIVREVTDATTPPWPSTRVAP
jgi:hypothetical protein